MPTLPTTGRRRAGTLPRVPRQRTHGGVLRLPPRVRKARKRRTRSSATHPRQKRRPSRARRCPKRRAREAGRKRRTTPAGGAPDAACAPLAWGTVRRKRRMREDGPRECGGGGAPRLCECRRRRGGEVSRRRQSCPRRAASTRDRPTGTAFCGPLLQPSHGLSLEAPPPHPSVQRAVCGGGGGGAAVGPRPSDDRGAQRSAALAAPLSHGRRRTAPNPARRWPLRTPTTSWPEPMRRS